MLDMIFTLHREMNPAQNDKQLGFRHKLSIISG